MINTKKTLFQIVAIVAVIVGAFYLAKVAESNESVKMLVSSYGYLGIFLIAFISGFNLIVPIPAAAFLPLFLESGLNLYISILLMSVGMTLADMVSYFIGKVGQRVISNSSFNNSKILNKLISFKIKYKNSPIVILFLFASLAPFPNELLLIPMGILGYGLRWIIPTLLVGNLIFNFLFALGLIEVFKVF